MLVASDDATAGSVIANARADLAGDEQLNASGAIGERPVSSPSGRRGNDERPRADVEEPPHRGLRDHVDVRDAPAAGADGDAVAARDGECGGERVGHRARSLGDARAREGLSHTRPAAMSTRFSSPPLCTTRGARARCPAAVHIAGVPTGTSTRGRGTVIRRTVVKVTLGVTTCWGRRGRAVGVNLAPMVARQSTEDALLRRVSTTRGNFRW